jgi:hypothetical protein
MLPISRKRGKVSRHRSRNRSRIVRRRTTHKEKIVIARTFIEAGSMMEKYRGASTRRLRCPGCRALFGSADALAEHLFDAHDMSEAAAKICARIIVNVIG